MIRASRVDLAAALLAAAAGPVVPELSVFTLWVTGHFFVFCNVVRLPRRLELAWAVALEVGGLGCAFAGRLRR